MNYSFIGSKVDEHRGALRLNHPMSRGIVTDWDDMRLLWDHAYEASQLNSFSEEHPVSWVLDAPACERV